MFTECFQENRQSLPGVSAYYVSLDPEEDSCSKSLNITPHKGTVTLFFCRYGSLTLTSKAEEETHVLAREILLLSDQAELAYVSALPPLDGICLSIDPQTVKDSLPNLCQFYNNAPSAQRQSQRPLDPLGHIYVIHTQPWTTSLFQILSELSPEDRSYYCIIKSFELLYLLNAHHQKADLKVVQKNKHSDTARTAREMRDYMLDHLSEKLLINDLSGRFHRSPTSCKNCFRACYGQSIHHWLLDRRMERAADLLEHSNLSILQIAQAVSYEGTSQFNMAFKLKYGLTPSQYRKNAGFR